ncbi:MAG: hypothetical protein WCA98_16550 [Candidatus Acidiferrales bacterium]
MPFDREMVEARVALDLITSDEMPKLAWDALESGLDGPAIRRLAALVRPTWFQVEEVRANAIREMKLSTLTIGDAACRLARRRAQEILQSGEDPLRCTRDLEQLWIKAQYPREMSILGTLDDEVSIARSMGSSEVDIRQWLIQRLRDSIAATSMGSGPISTRPGNRSRADI